MIRILDFQEGKVIPTIDCYKLATLKAVIDEFPEEYMEILAYLYYMTCPNPEQPFFNTREEDKEPMILKEVKVTVSLDHPTIVSALAFLRDLYETPTSRLFSGLKTMMDRMAEYLETAQVTHGRDGNINSLLRAGKEFSSLKKSYNEMYKDLMEDQKSRNRGGSAYDGRH